MSRRPDPDFDDGWLPEQEEKEGDFPAFLMNPKGVIERRGRWMLAFLVLGLCITGLLVARWQPYYLARSTVVVTSQQIPEEFVRSTVRENSIANIDSMMGEVLAQDSLSKVIDKFDLYADQRGRMRIELVNRLRKNFTLAPTTKEQNQDGTTLIYALSFGDVSAARAADVANELANLLVKEAIARRSQTAQRTTEFLKRELGRDEASLKTATQAVTEFRRAHRGQLPSELEANLQRLQMLSERGTALLERIAERDNQIATVAAAGTDHPTEAQALLTELRREYAREVAVHTEEHPNVASLRRRVAVQEETVARENAAGRGLSPQTRVMIDAYKHEIASLRTQLKKTEEDMATINEEIDQTPEVAEQLAALTRKEAVVREDYLDTLRKVEEAELAETLESEAQGAQVAVLDRAEPPTRPERPRLMVLSLGLAGSLFACLAVGILLEYVDPVVVTIRQLDGLSDAPVLGAFPHIT